MPRLNSFCSESEFVDRRIMLVLELFDKQLFDEQLPDDIKMLTAAAKLVNLSLSRLRHLFKQQLGISPIRRLKEIRLAKSRELLQISSLSVKEVVAMAGLADMSHFLRNYKGQYGETPSETRAARAALIQGRSEIRHDVP